MIKQTITYTDFNDVSQTEDFYFNLSKRELAEMEVLAEADAGENAVQNTTPGGSTIAAQLQAIIDSGDSRAILETFKDIIKRAYGIRSEDGAMFSKSEEATKRFSDSGAMDSLLLQFFQDPNVASTFVNGIIPADLQGASQAAQATNGFRPGSSTAPPTPPVVTSVTPPVDATPAPVVADPTPAVPVDTTPVAATPVTPEPPVVTGPVQVVTPSAPVEAAPDPVQAAAPVDATPVAVPTEVNDPSWPVDTAPAPVNPVVVSPDAPTTPVTGSVTIPADSAPVSTDPTQAVSIDPSVPDAVSGTTETETDTTTTGGVDASPLQVDPSVIVNSDTTATQAPVDTDQPVPVTDPRLVTDSPLFNATTDDTGVTPPAAQD